MSQGGAVGNGNVPNAVDIAALVQNTNKLTQLLKPIQHLVEGIDKIRCWECPSLCIVLLFMNNGACILLPTGYYLLPILCLLGCVICVGITHMKYRLLLKVIPSSNKKKEDYFNPETESHHQMMNHFRLVIGRTDYVVKMCTDFFTAFYSVIKWEDQQFSILCYSIISFVLVLLNVLPLRWNLTLASDVFLLHYPVQQYMHKKSISNIKETDETISVCQKSSTDTQTSSDTAKSDVPETSGTAKTTREEAEIVDDTDEDVSEKFSSSCDSSDNEADSNSYSEKSPVPGLNRTGVKTEPKSDLTSSQETVTRSGVVGRIIEFKKKHQQAGSCIGCNVNFTTILKRRRTCNFCGNHFCSKCCCKKVPKSLFGATAPGAQTELVLVCHFCNNYLTASKKAS